MSLIAAAKCCLFCGESWFWRMKAKHQKKMFEFLSDARKRAVFDCEEGLIEHEDHEEIITLISDLEQACLRCSGKAEEVYVAVVAWELSTREFEDEDGDGEAKKEEPKTKKETAKSKVIDIRTKMTHR